ncbi:MAG: 3',5'-cyclic-nucleotide phosphodiesterase [Thermodesulfovibrionales bacterium]|nr:3',5'-cyclic-nucleotide phosphodiesterase [Thermodesulfovibrionales bacterium]
MKIRVLGCSGAEMPGHNPSSFLIDGVIVLDAGSITSTLNEKEQCNIKSIFVTHAHLDHIRGIPFLADNLIINKPDIRFEVLSIKPIIKAMKDNLLNSTIWPDFTDIPHPKDGIIKLTELKENKERDELGYKITPIKVNHTVPAVGYLVVDKNGKSLFYTGDTGPTPKTWKRLKNICLDALIIEVSFPNKMKELALMTGHLTAELMLNEIKSIKCMPKKIFITHPKPQYLKQIITELEALKMKNIILLEEGKIINI